MNIHPWLDYIVLPVAALAGSALTGDGIGFGAAIGVVSARALIRYLVSQS